jgi:hypothetical protein
MWLRRAPKLLLFRTIDYTKQQIFL